MKAKYLAFITALASALICPAHAQSFQSASEQAKKDLSEALNQLNEVRGKIAAEKIPLIREVTRLEDEVKQKEDELNRLRRLRDNKDLSLNRLRKRVEGLKAQNEYTASLLDQFVTAFETRIDFSETQIYSEKAKTARMSMLEPDLSQTDLFLQQLEVIASALDRMEELVGGYTFLGEAKASDGEILEGSFAVFGPTVYFASTDGSISGVTVDQVNSSVPAVANLGDSFTGITSFIEDKTGNIPLDPTLGKALKIEESKETIGQHIEKGGAVGIVIISLGAVCLIIGLIKLYEITSFKTPKSSEVQAVLSQIESGDTEKAAIAAAQISGVGGELLQTGVEFMEEKRGTLEEILYEKILGVRPKLERFLPFMALTAAAAPLLGLLGTVTGMINTFKLITVFGTGDAKSLSSGISEALVTTELGLIVAIPSLILHGLLSRMAKQKLGDMEQTAVGFINGVVAARGNDSKDAA